jgi:hypothetical protein
MEPSPRQISALKGILPLLKETVSDLNLFRYYPLQYDQKYSSPFDKVNPHDKVMLNDVEKIDQVITPVFKELGILGVIWQGVNPYKNKSNLFMEEFVSLYMKLNFLMDPDNFPDLPEDR